MFRGCITGEAGVVDPFKRVLEHGLVCYREEGFGQLGGGHKVLQTLAFATEDDGTQAEEGVC